jgi:hypothetical protein
MVILSVLINLANGLEVMITADVASPASAIRFFIALRRGRYIDPRPMELS